jgi:hypothetical protein
MTHNGWNGPQALPLPYWSLLQIAVSFVAYAKAVLPPRAMRPSTRLNLNRLL